MLSHHQCQGKGYTGDLGCGWTWTLLRGSRPALWQTCWGSPPVPPPTWDTQRHISVCVKWIIILCVYHVFILSVLSFILFFREIQRQGCLHVVFLWAQKRTFMTQYCGWQQRIVLNLTYPRPEDRDHDDEVGYDGQEPRRDQAAQSRHAGITITERLNL